MALAGPSPVEAAQSMLKRWKLRPTLALVLGSGFGGVLSKCTVVFEVPYSTIPGFPRLKEWAYAGMMFDVTGAAASRTALGDGVGMVLAPLFIGAFVVASWALRPENRVSCKQATHNQVGV